MACFYIILGIYLNNQILIIGLFIFFHSLWNLNPFLRNDGYWVLSDVLNYPNLTKNSFLLLKNLILSFFKKSKFEYNLKNIFLIIYAFLNQSFIFVFFYYSIINYGSNLLSFPYDFIKYVITTMNNHLEINVEDLIRFIIPFIFYFVLIKFIKGLVRRFYKKVKIK